MARRYVTELRSNAFAISLMDGRSTVARLGVGDVGRGNMMVRSINVAPGSQRQGVATGLYERAAKIACKTFGAPLASDQHRTPRADAFWKKQEAKGRATRVDDSKYGDYYVLACPAPKSLAGPRRRR